VRLVAVGLALGLGLGACDRRAPIAACSDDLRGVYAPEGASERRWMILDNGDTLEAYPLFDDSAPATGLEVAPRVIDLSRTGGGITGNVRRRYLRGVERCDARVPVRVTACADDGLELVLADPEPPIATAPCAWPRPGGSRVERWRRE
jgi:hypothetical protein